MNNLNLGRHWDTHLTIIPLKITIDTAIKAGFGFRLGVMGLIEFVDLGAVQPKIYGIR